MGVQPTPKSLQEISTYEVFGKLKTVYHNISNLSSKIFGGGSGILTPFLVLTEDAHQRQCLTTTFSNRYLIPV